MLIERHLADLRRSGLSDQTIAAADIRSLTADEVRRFAGRLKTVNRGREGERMRVSGNRAWRDRTSGARTLGAARRTVHD